MATSLLPPNASALERALEAATRRIDDVPVPLRDLWDPLACPIDLLPWLAWSLSIDIWDSDWSEAAKREQVAQALQMQRRKGSVASVRSLLDAYEAGLTLTEWFETQPPGPVHTFDVTLPLSGEVGAVARAAYIEKVAARIVITKPVRSHFRLVQSVEGRGDVGLLGRARSWIYGRRSFLADIEDSAGDWAGVLLTEDGEPFLTEEGPVLEIDP